MRVGDIEIIALSDGEFLARPEFFGPTASFESHRELLDADGVWRLPVGVFALVDGEGVTLVDAGIGMVDDDLFSGGRLLDDMARHGIRRHDVREVVCTHLHPDHVGWLVRHDDLSPVFPHARVVVGTPDWHLFVDERQEHLEDHIVEGLLHLAERDRVTLVTGDVTIRTGIGIMAAPGHTPGHSVVVVSHGDQRVLLLGDAITCPLQLHEPEWAAISDVDPALAARTRELLWREMERPATVAAGSHFPELQFGRVLRGRGRRWFA